MPSDINGNFTTQATNPSGGTLTGPSVFTQQAQLTAPNNYVRADVVDSTLEDIVTFINQCLLRSGVKALTGSIDFGNFKGFNALKGSALDDVATLRNISEMGLNIGGNTGGTPPTYFVTTFPFITPMNGMMIWTQIHNTTSSGPITINVNSLGAKQVLTPNYTTVPLPTWRGRHFLVYDVAALSGAGAWICITPLMYQGAWTPVWNTSNGSITATVDQDTNVYSINNDMATIAINSNVTPNTAVDWIEATIPTGVAGSWRRGYSASGGYQAAQPIIAAPYSVELINNGSLKIRFKRHPYYGESVQFNPNYGRFTNQLWNMVASVTYWIG